MARKVMGFGAVAIAMGMVLGCGNGGETSGAGGTTMAPTGGSGGTSSEGGGGAGGAGGSSCTPNPCLNGGTCVENGDSFTCTCPAGFTGSNCQTNIDDCSPNPCQNGSSCVDGVNAHTCSCVPGYSGDNCETNIDDCSPNPCQNGATCVDGVNAHSCTCIPGYTGDNCETNIDDCSPNPCQNGGTCVDGLQSYTCDCLVGYTGNNCETVVSGCVPNPCQNGGTCNDLGGGSYSCSCAPGYTGNNCAINIDDCTPNPCQNGGLCNDGVNSYSCSCAPGYTGNDCEIDIDDCTPNPCQNGGTCNDGVNSYSCSCVNGYTGTNCEIEPQYCDVLYTVASGNCGVASQNGRFHNIKTGLGAMNLYYNVGKNCTSPKRGTGNGTSVASPFTPAAFPRGYLRLRFTASGTTPLAGQVQLIEYYMPIEFTVNGMLNTNVSTDVDHSAGLLAYSQVGCPVGYTGCLTGVSDTVAPTLNRTCTPVASGTLNGTALTWGACALSPPPPCLGTGCTASNAELNWAGSSSQIDTASNSGCVANMNNWGGVWCTSGMCSFVPGTDAPSNDTWDQKLPNLTFNSADYAAPGTAVTLTEFIVPDAYADVYSGTEVITAAYLSKECGTLAALTCDEN